MENSADCIIDHVENNSYMDYEGHEGDELMFATREHGNVGDETPGKKDIQHARDLAKEIRACCGDIIKVIELEVVDEWVYLRVRLNPIEKD